MAVQVKSEIILPAGASVQVVNPAPGWDEKFQRLDISGQVASLVIHVGERAGVAIRITEDGNLSITNFGGYYTQFAPQHLANTRPWDREE